LASLVGFVTIAWLVGVSVHPQQSDRRDRIAGRSGRILKRLAAGAEHAEWPAVAIRRNFRIEETAGNRIEESLDHGIHNAAREIEITQVAGRLIGIEAGACGKRVIIE